MVQTRAETDTDRVRVKKQAILRAAALAFRAKGFRDTSMRDVAASLGMTVGNLYYYFESKRSLLAFCQHETLSRLLELAHQHSRQAGSAHERLHALITDHVVCINESMPGAIAHLTLDPLPEAERRRCIERRDEYEHCLRELVRQGVERGLFRAIDPKVAVWTILGAINATAAWYRPDGDRAARDVGTAMADQLVRGLLAPGVELQRGHVELDDIESIAAPRVAAIRGRAL